MIISGKSRDISAEIDREMRLYYEVNRGYEPTSMQVCKQGSETTGHDDFPPAKMETGSPDVWVNSMPISRRTDVYEEHSNEFDSHRGMNWESSETVFVNQLGISRVGDRVVMRGSYSGGGTNHPTAKKPDPDKDEVELLINPALTVNVPYQTTDYPKPPVCKIKGSSPVCNSYIKTGSEDVYCGSKRYEQVPGFGFEDDPASVNWGCTHTRE